MFRILPLITFGFLFAFSARAAFSDILINEVLPNPSGSETQNEFIEIYNSGDQNEDLSGFLLKDKTGTVRQYAIPFGTAIAAHSYLAFYSGVTNISLNNTGDGVELINGTEKITEINFGEGSEDSSFARKPDGSFEWTASLTPNAENIFPDPVATPSPSPSATPSLTATPDAAPTPEPTAEPTSTPTPESEADYSLAEKIIINEILPNPIGDDKEGEFIELYNPNEVDIDLTDFYLDDETPGSEYEFPEGTKISGRGYLLVKCGTKVVLNNSDDRARFFSPAGDIFYELTYGKIPKEGTALAIKPDGAAEWTNTPTPGKENIFSPVIDAAAINKKRGTVGKIVNAPVSQENGIADEEQETKKSVAVKKTVVKKTKIAKKNPIESAKRVLSEETTRKPREISLKEARDLPVGEFVRTRGVVLAPPGAVDDRLIYLSGSGTGVILLSGDFPALKLGDAVWVEGYVAEVRKEKFIILKDNGGLIIDKFEAEPEPEELSVLEIDKEKTGMLAKVSGTIEEIDGDGMTIMDGGENMVVRLNGFSEENKNSLKTGKRVTVTGVIASIGEETFLAIRTPADLLFQEKLKREPKFVMPNPELNFNLAASFLCFAFAFVLFTLLPPVPLLRKW